MGVLFIMPNWSAYSELWIQRMLEALEPQLAAVGALAPTERTWRGKIPSLALGAPAPSIWRRACHRAGLRGLVQQTFDASRVLQEAAESPAVTVVLAHYLDFAVRFQDVWDRTEKPLFVHCHGYDVTWDLREFHDPEQAVFPPDYVNRVRRLASRAWLIANSKSTKQRLLDLGIPPDRILVKYLGVPVPDSPPPHPDHTRGLEVLFLGRLIDFKGPDVVIRAFERACEQGLDARLTLAGDGPLRPECERLIRRSVFSKKMRLLGQVDAARGDELRRGADIFTAHSCRGPRTQQEEAFGVAFVEAMASGLPVVSGRNGSLLETVVHGETGILVEPGDVAAHAQALLTLSVEPDLRRRMGEAGWRRAKVMFSLERERVALMEILGLRTTSA